METLFTSSEETRTENYVKKKTRGGYPATKNEPATALKWTKKTYR